MLHRAGAVMSAAGAAAGRQIGGDGREGDRRKERGHAAVQQQRRASADEPAIPC